MSNKENKEIYTDKTTISCDGKEQNSPHPKIYLNLLPNNTATCPYCNLKFILKNKNKLN